MSIIAGPQNFMQCDFDRGFAFGWVTPGTAADHAWLQYQFLTPGGIALAQQRAFAPLHGALVMRQGTGVMFCGDSCAGKSTLAYACARAGWTYVTDDGTFLVRGRDDRYAVGDSQSIRFRTDAPELFPELSNYVPTATAERQTRYRSSHARIGTDSSQGMRCGSRGVPGTWARRPGNRRAATQEIARWSIGRSIRCWDLATYERHSGVAMSFYYALASGKCGTRAWMMQSSGWID